MSFLRRYGFDLVIVVAAIVTTIEVALADGPGTPTVWYAAPATAVLILSLLVWFHEKAGAWVIACGLMRYGFVATGFVLSWMAGPLRSTLRGKSVAVGQSIGQSMCWLVSKGWTSQSKPPANSVSAV